MLEERGEGFEESKGFEEFKGIKQFKGVGTREGKFFRGNPGHRSRRHNRWRLRRPLLVAITALRRAVRPPAGT